MMKKELTPTQKAFISEFGNLYSSYGFKRLNGLIIGLLLTSNEPLSLDEISKSLNRSKGLISSATRHLKSHGFIKSFDGLEKRKDYYTADDEIFLNVFHFNMATVRKNITIAERFLIDIESEDIKIVKKLKKNLVVMNAFYHEMNTFYEDFDRVWNQKRKKIKF